MEDEDKLVGVAAEPEPKEPTFDEITEDSFTKFASEDHLQQAVNRVLAGNLDEIVKQALQQALQKALEPIVSQAIEKALAPTISQSIEPASNSIPRSITPGFVCPDPARFPGGRGGTPCNKSNEPI